MTNEQHSSYPREADELIERRSDQGVWNVAMGEAAVHGFYSRSENSGDRATASTVKKPRSRVNHSGGRGLVEGPGGQDVSRMLANQDATEHPVSPAEQRENNENSPGYAQFKAARKKLELDEAGRHVQERTDYDPDYPDKAAAEEVLAMNAVMRKIHDQRTGSS